MDSFACAVVLVAEEARRNALSLKMHRKILRDATNPLEIEDAMFIKNYRLNKAAFNYVLSVLEEGSPGVARSSSMSNLHRLASVLRFFAEGGYQHGVGKDHDIPMAQSTFSSVLMNVLQILEVKLCPQWIKLEMTENEKRQAKMNFYTKYRFPGVILSVDGTHIKIIAPTKDKFLYFNRKGYYSINAMIICDYKMQIHYVNAQYPGSNHDSHIWNVSSAREFFEKNHVEGERNTWILGDSGYALEPWLMTPFRSPPSGSRESTYNTVHAKARNVVERTIGVLKNRFRCLLGARELHYEPRKASQIVNVAAALHNICLHFRVADDVSDNADQTFTSESADESPQHYNNEASQIRQLIVDALHR